MSFVLTRYIENLTIDKEFAQSLATELRSNQINEGVLLLVAKKIELESSYTLSYNNPSQVNFPGQYALIIVADELQSKEGEIGRIDLSGRTGRHPPKQRTGENGQNADKKDTDEGEQEVFAEGGGDGTTGDPGGKGWIGSKIKLLCSELGKIEILANGGVGGKGGTGGNGGKGGDGAMVVIDHRSVTLPPAPGGNGAMGGIGGDGGNAGTIEGLYCKTESAIFFQSVGGAPGEGGEGGEAGKGGRIQLQHAADGHPGGKTTLIGIRGSDSTISVKQVEFSELWEKVVTELKIPTG